MELIFGFIVSAVVVYFSIRWLVSLLQRGHFWYFGVYCLTIGIATFFLLGVAYVSTGRCIVGRSSSAWESSGS